MVNINFSEKDLLLTSFKNSLEGIFIAEVLPGNIFKLLFANNSFLKKQCFANAATTGTEISSFFTGEEESFLREKLIECTLSKKEISFKHTDRTFVYKDYWFTQFFPLLNRHGTVERIFCISKKINVPEKGNLFAGNKALLSRLFEIFPMPVLVPEEPGMVVESGDLDPLPLRGGIKEDGVKIKLQDTPAVSGPIFVPHYSQLTLSWLISSKEFSDKTVMPTNEQEYGIAVDPDVIEQKKRAEKIFTSKNILEAILNSLPDAILFLNTESKLVSYNNAAAKLSEMYGGKQLKEGNYITEYTLPGESEILIWQHLNQVHHKKEVSYEHKLGCGTLEETWFCRRYYPALDKNGNYVGCLISSVNITNHKKRALYIKKQHKQLMEIAKIQKEELTTPLATVLGIIKLLTAKSKLNKALLLSLKESADQLEFVIRNKTGVAGIV